MCVIGRFPPLLVDLPPPYWVALVASHDDVGHINAGFFLHLFLHLCHTPGDDRNRRKAVGKRYVATVTLEVVVPDMNRNILEQRDKISGAEMNNKAYWRDEGTDLDLQGQADIPF